MTEKRFKYIMFDGFEDNGEYLNPQEVVKILNELYEENKKIKQLIHTMLVQIEVEKINTENARYLATIIFTLEEFKKMRQIWKGDF